MTGIRCDHVQGHIGGCFGSGGREDESGDTPIPNAAGHGAVDHEELRLTVGTLPDEHPSVADRLRECSPAQA